MVAQRLQYRPSLTVDGVNHPVEWGTNRIVLPAGRHVLQAGVDGGTNPSPPLEVEGVHGLEVRAWSMAAMGFKPNVLSLAPIPPAAVRGGWRAITIGILCALMLVLLVLLVLLGMNY